MSLITSSFPSLGSECRATLQFMVRRIGSQYYAARQNLVRKIRSSLGQRSFKE